MSDLNGDGTIDNTDAGLEAAALNSTASPEDDAKKDGTEYLFPDDMVGWNINPYSTIDGFQAVRSQGNGGVYGSQTELGHIVATSGTSPFGTSGQAGSYTGTATFPLAVNNSDQCLEEHDSGYTALFPTSPYPDWTPGTTTYTVGTTPVPSGLTPIASKGALSNTNAFGAYDVIGSNGQYVCWDGTHTIPLPPSSSANVSVSPVGVNAATTTITVPGTGTNPPTTQVVSATQVIGNYSVSNPNPPPAYLSTGYIWNMIPSTNAIPTFANPQKLDTLVPGYGTTNAVWSGIAASSINDSGAIVGTATYSGSNTNIATGSHGVMLIPDSIQRDGQVINSTNNTVWVGQQINLTNMVLGSATNAAVTSYHWAIPGANNTTNDTAFYAYQPDAYHSNYTNLFSPTNYLTNSHVNFYWSSGGSNQVVYCTNVIYGQTNVVSATFNVSRPTDVITTPQIGTITAGTNDPDYPGDPRLAFGNVSSFSTVGILFTNAAPSAASIGISRWVQLITSDVVTNMPSGVADISRVGCDGLPNFPYNSGSQANDSPNGPLISTNTSTSRYFNATMYLMWQPTNSLVLNGDKTVMVPLKGYPWHRERHLVTRQSCAGHPLLGWPYCHFLPGPRRRPIRVGGRRRERVRRLPC